MGRRGNDEGSIWRRADGRWSGSVFVPNRIGGRDRKYVYGATREDVHRKIVELQGQVQRGLPVATGQQTLGAYLTSWLKDVAAHRVRANTLTGYRVNIERHIIPRVGRKRLAALTAKDVRQLLDECRAAGLSDRSVRYVHATLRVALEDAMREDHLARNVAKLVRLSTPQRPETRILSAAEGRTLLRATRDDRLSAALVLLLLLGLRRSEVLGLRWQDVDVDQGVLHVRQGLHWLEGRLQFLPPKTRRSRRSVPLPALCARALEDHRERMARERGDCPHPWEDNDLVFVTTVGTPAGGPETTSPGRSPGGAATPECLRAQRSIKWRSPGVSGCWPVGR